MSDSTTISSAELKQYISRIERCNEDVKSAQEDVKTVYQDAKSSGYDTKIMRIIIARRAKDKHVLDEEEMLLETYLTALGDS